MEASQKSFEKHPRLKKWFDRFTESQGYIGKTVRQRYERCEDWSPADHTKIAFYVQLSEGILDNCKREPVLLEENIYYDLLYRAVINMPRIARISSWRGQRNYSAVPVVKWFYNHEAI